MLCGLIGAIIGLINYYNKYNDLKNDDSKKVKLIDFEGHMKHLGTFVQYGKQGDNLTIQVQSTDNVEEWTIKLDSKYTYNPYNAIIDYSITNEMLIFTDFLKSDFKNRIIVPLLAPDIMKVGLVQGIKEIRAKASPLYVRIRSLEEIIEELEREIRDINRQNFRKILNFISNTRDSTIDFLSTANAQITTAVKIIEAALRKESEEQLEDLKDFLHDTKPRSIPSPSKKESTPTTAPISQSIDEDIKI